jgi:hypothetical protein
MQAIALHLEGKSPMGMQSTLALWVPPLCQKQLFFEHRKPGFSCVQIEVLSGLKFMGFLARPPKKLNSWV